MSNECTIATRRSTIPLTDANSTDAGLTTVDNTLARRRYFREKQRNHRRKVNSDVAIVEAELAYLQSIWDILQASMPPSMAPREASDGPLSCARYLGKEWLTQQMYHNTRQALALLPAMTCDDEFFQFDLQASDQHDDLFMERIQMEVRQVSPTHILMRYVSHLSHVFRAHDGFLSMAELAVLEGIDVTGIDDDDKDAYVRREFVRRGNDDLVPWRQWFTGLLQASLQ
ncbi:hypothetical protein DYB26_004362 [Aphanomyces astaci]|uniref:Uncharacterized protein n=1 Tax=Aphanomyces astaci TaxID=112090 RepID=A0A3R7BG67_APHAT|nr:hypothetical protein DYB26_004362 [Aphanomyces astaci]